MLASGAGQLTRGFQVWLWSCTVSRQATAIRQSQERARSEGDRMLPSPVTPTTVPRYIAGAQAAIIVIPKAKEP